MRNNEKGIALGFTIISLLVALLVASSFYGSDKSSQSIATGVYMQCWGILFFLSYFYSYKTFFFRGLIWVCENFSYPKGRKMAFFYFALTFGLGSMSILQGITEAKQKPPIELEAQNSEMFCLENPPSLKEFSIVDSQDSTSQVLLSTSFEPTGFFSAKNISPFITNEKAPLNITSNCSNSGQYALNVIPEKTGIFQQFFPPQMDRIKMGSKLSSSFNSNMSFNVTNLNSVTLNFARYSTSNPDKRSDFNCGSSLNVYYRLDNNNWIHKMSYCGQHITETTGWKKRELIFDTQSANTIDFLFAYESLSIANNPVLYLIDDLIITGKK